MRLYFITQLHLTFVLILMLNFSAGSEYVTAESVRVASRMRNNEQYSDLIILNSRNSAYIQASELLGLLNCL